MKKKITTKSNVAEPETEVDEGVLANTYYEPIAAQSVSTMYFNSVTEYHRELGQIPIV